MDILFVIRGVIDGALYVLTSPLALCSLLAACLLPGSSEKASSPAGLVLFVAGAVATRWLPVVEQPMLVPGILLALGLMLAVNRQVSSAAALVIKAVAGIAAGLGGGMQLASWSELVGGGLAFGSLYALAWLATALLLPRGRLIRAIAVGRRMVGAWIAAVGILMLALASRIP